MAAVGRGGGGRAGGAGGLQGAVEGIPLGAQRRPEVAAGFVSHPGHAAVQARPHLHPRRGALPASAPLPPQATPRATSQVHARIPCHVDARAPAAQQPPRSAAAPRGTLPARC